MTDAVQNEANQQQIAQEENKLIAERRSKLEHIRKGCKANGHPNDFRRDSLAGDLQEKFGEKSKEELETLNHVVAIAGRVMAKRGPFLVIQETSGRIQAYASKEVQQVLKEKYQGLDIGDIIGVKGALHKSGKGDLYVNMEEFELLTKALRPLPEKFHGLTDQEMRYRQRYVDLIVNEESRNAFVIRSKVMSAIRNFMISKQFMEVETPMMHVIPGGQVHVHSSLITMRSICPCTCVSRLSFTSNVLWWVGLIACLKSTVISVTKVCRLAITQNSP